MFSDARSAAGLEERLAVIRSARSAENQNDCLTTTASNLINLTLMAYRKSVPKINVGRYAGTPIDQLPNSYLRWMLSQDFPKAWLEIARDKLKESPYSSEYLSVSRHTYDQFSLRFIEKWDLRSDKSVGLGTFIANEALRAWAQGIDVSKHRHQNDGILKEFDGIVWVFNVSQQFPDYKEVITCYEKQQFKID